MTQQTIRPVILCGGSGTRLWPVSRKSMPKQFARLNGERTLLQNTIQRLEDAGCGAPVLITNEAYRFTVAAQCEELGLQGHRIVIEPQARNTAAAICAAAELLYKDDREALILVAPSDHVVGDGMSFSKTVAKATKLARDGAIVTFGTQPDRVETGFGYIEVATTAGDQPRRIQRFVEKPAAATAAAMIEAGNVLWNSGLFMFTAPTVRTAFGKCAPKLRAAVRAALRDASPDLDFLRLGPSFAAAPDISFDQAVMEKTGGWVVPMQAGWSDLGTWRSVWGQTEKDADGVALRGSARGIDCADSLLFSDDSAVELVGIGVKNIAAIATRDAVLIADLDNSQAVSQVVAQMRSEDLRQADDFPRAARPWGHYETLALGPRFQVKSIEVKPGGTLSLQSHVHRAEHWVVVAGTASVTIGTQEQLVTENQSVYIPLGEVHRLANHGKLPLKLIEVQTGSYLGEDDIFRYDDVYERA